MEHNFTFTDRMQAILANCTCLGCFSKSSSEDDLQGNHGAADADALSLHSTYPSAHSSRHLPQKTSKKITLLGWNLFGHGNRGIQLPDSDNEEEDQVSLFGKRRKQRRGRDPAAESSSTLDSDADAAPLDPTLIDVHAAEEAERRQKELEKAERRRLRRERKELKRMALATPFEDNQFEGFPASASGLQPPFSPTIPQLTPSPRFERTNEEAEPDADLDGSTYFARTSHRNGSRSGSDSRSQTSASYSTDGTQYAYRPHHSGTGSPTLPSPQLPIKKKRSKKSTQSSSSTSASISLPSPAAVDVLFQPLIQGHDPLPADEDDYDTRFPSVGFTGAPRLKKTGGLRDQGAKLAQAGF